MSPILVTGASGFIGAAVLRALAGRDLVVHAVRRNHHVAADHPADPVIWHAADLLDPTAIAPLIRRTSPAVLIHLAWVTSHPEFWTAPTNLDWTAATLRLARSFAEQGGRRFIGLGTSAEYRWDTAEASTLPIDEMRSERKPQTLYGAAKNATCDLLSAFFAARQIEFAWGCLFHPFGPGEDRSTLVPGVIKTLMAGQPALCTAGSQRRDFIHVDDVGEAIVSLACTSAAGRFNIGAGAGTSVADVVTRIAGVIGRPDLVRLGALPSRPDDPEQIVACIDRIRNETGWLPRISLDEGIRGTVEWWRARGGNTS